jgi:uncharacterized protein (DUF1499 family)
MTAKTSTLFFCLIGTLAISACTGSVPTTLGQFAPCPASPNCISTQAKDATHAIAPILYSDDRKSAQKRLLKIIHSLPGARVVTEKDDYLHVQFTSSLLRFVDDVEFYFAVEEGKIHFRSASRIGHSDLGVNRKRVEAIRSRFASSEPASTHNIQPSTLKGKDP